MRVDPGFGEAGDVDTAVIVLEHCTARSRRSTTRARRVYGYDQRVEVFGSAGMAASENPLAHSTIVRTASGVRAATLPYFFLERYIPSYLGEWEAFVSAVANGTPARGGCRGCAGAARDRAHGLAVPARRAAGAAK